jgi:DNA-binding NarL/FixJ family response regulator
MTKISVILVDDHAVVRAGFRLLLAEHESLEVLAEGSRGEEVFQLYQEKKPDVLVMDLSMPGIGGLECIRRLLARAPEAKILVFSVHDEQVYVSRALAAGAKGYITKNSAPTILAEAIEQIATGNQYVEAGLAGKHDHKKTELSNPENDYQQLIKQLTAKEFDIFCLLAKGFTTQKIAAELCLGYKTVANYGTQIKSKLNAATVAELAHIAAILGIIKVSPENGSL